ncbi:MAG TPA: ABC transporter permease [Vicinamibacterales bacterium]|nr:ABC transporter permease [Vicinamibacterales bacterium]
MKRSLRSWLWRVPLDREFDEEVELHIDMRTRELIDEGVDPATAREMAIKKMGDLAAFKKTCVDLGRKRDREMSMVLWLEELRDDVTFAFRQLRNAPAFTLVAVLTLALGIGANSAIFALVDATLLRPLPYGEPDRLVTIWETTTATPRGYASPPNMLDWAARNRTLESVAAYTPSMGSMVMAGRDGNAQTVSRQWVTRGVFDVFGVKPIAGRTFTPDDEQQRRRAVVISEGLWETRFNRDPAMVGGEIRLDGELWQVVGVMPSSFEILGRTSIWGMRPFPPSMPPRARAAYQLQVVGRMKPGVTIEAAQADLASVANALAQEYAEFNKGRTVTIEPLHDTMIGGDLKTTAMLFLGVVGFVLLICCANVANLLLARATARARELAVRSALGAGRRRIIRQLLTESIVLSIIGGMLGVAVGAAILRVAPAMVPEGLLPPAVTLGFDARVVAFCACAALIVGVIFGIAPAFQATAASPAEAMGADSRTTTGSGGKLRNLLVVGEVAMAVLLLFGAGLLLRTLIAVQSYDRGYRAESVLSMLVDPLGSAYPTPERLQQFFDQVEAEVRAVPGVADVGWSSAPPLGESLFGDDYLWSYEIVGDPPVEDARKPTTAFTIVSPSYFSTLDLPIVAGRAFDSRDHAKAPPVVIVNEAFARSLGNRNPIGLQVSYKVADSPTAKPRLAQIVGVAKQVKFRPDESRDYVQLFVPLAQDLVDDMLMMVRSKTGRADALTPAVRSAITRIDKDQLVSVAGITTLEDVEWAATGRHRFRAVMVAAFAALAVTLAMVGVFGILAYSVQQRVRDFGLRRALGATSRDLTGLVVGSAIKVILAGLVIGLALSAGFSQLISTMLFGVEPLDFVTFAAVMLVLGLTTALSIAGPAWRAARIDPSTALRSK